MIMQFGVTLYVAEREGNVSHCKTIELYCKQETDDVSFGLTVCIMLGLPYETTYQDVESFLEPFAKEIQSVQVIKIITPFNFNVVDLPTSCCVIRFSCKESLSAFSELYNNLHFTDYKEAPPCLVIPLENVTEVEVGDRVVETSTVNNRDEKIISASDNNKKILPTCCICLRRIKTSVTGISGVNDILVTPSYQGNTGRCEVCYILGFDSGDMNNDGTDIDCQSRRTYLQSLRQCHTCGLSDNIWLCLVCCHAGCGRFTRQHAKQHYETTKHCFSLELASRRIWDYENDAFVNIEDASGTGWSGVHVEYNITSHGNSDCVSSSSAEGSAASCGNCSVFDKQNCDQTRNTESNTNAFELMKEFDTKSIKCNNINNNSLLTGHRRSLFSSLPAEDKLVKQKELVDLARNMTSAVSSRASSSSMLSRPVVDKLGCIVAEYEDMLQSQLLEQQMYFEKKLARETILALELSLLELHRANEMNVNSKNSGGIGRSNINNSNNDSNTGSTTTSGGSSGSYDAEIHLNAEDFNVITQHKMELSSLEYEYGSSMNELRELEKSVRKVRKNNDGFIREIKELKQQLAKVEENKQVLSLQKNAQIAELEQQVRDLSFYTRAQAQVNSSRLKDELQDGQVLVPVTQNQRQQKKNNRKSK